MLRQEGEGMVTVSQLLIEGSKIGGGRSGGGVGRRVDEQQMSAEGRRWLTVGAAGVDGGKGREW